MSKKHALLLCNDYEAPFLNVARQYASYFCGTEYSPVVVFLKGAPDNQVAKSIDSEHVIFINAHKAQLNGFKSSLVKEIKNLHANYHFEFVVAHRYRAMFIATHLKNVPVLGVFHITGNFRRLSRKLYVSTCRNLTILGVSKAIRNDIRKSLPFIKKHKIVHLYNSLDFHEIKANMIDRKSAKSALGIADNKFCFVNVGRLHEDKDQATLIKAFGVASKKMTNALLYIAGSGRLESELKELVELLELQDRVVFLGNIPDFYQYLRAFDCFVLSSVREGLSVALLEAYAAELPPILSLCSGNTEAIESVCEGFNIGDKNELALKLDEYYSMSPEDIQHLKLKIDQKVNANFTLDAVKSEFWKIVSTSKENPNL